MTASVLDAKASAVFCLARGYTTDKTGKEVGVAGRTVRRWREDPAFEAEVAAARRAILSEAVAALGAATRDAVEALHRALEDDSASIRVRAASVLLGALPGITEHAELEARIAALETGLEQRSSAA